MDVKEVPHHRGLRNNGRHHNNPEVTVESSTPRVQIERVTVHRRSRDSPPLSSTSNDPTGSYRQQTNCAAEISKIFDRPDSGLSYTSSELDSGFDDLRSFMVTPTLLPPLPGPLQPETDLDVIRRVNAESASNFLDGGKDNGKEQEQDGDKSCHSNRSDQDVSLSSELYQSDDLAGMMNKSISPSPEREDRGHVTGQHVAELANDVTLEFHAKTSMNVVESHGESRDVSLGMSRDASRGESRDVSLGMSRDVSRGESRDFIEATGNAGDGVKETDTRRSRRTMLVTPGNNSGGASCCYSSTKLAIVGDNDMTSNNRLDLFQMSGLSSSSALKQNTNGTRLSSAFYQLDKTETPAKEHDECESSGMASSFEICSCSTLLSMDTVNGCHHQQSSSVLDVALRFVSAENNSVSHTSESVDELERQSTVSPCDDVESDHVRALSDQMMADRTPAAAAAAAARTSSAISTVEDVQKVNSGSSASVRRRARKQKSTTKRPREDSPHSLAINPCRKLSVAATSMDDTFDSNGYDVSPSVESAFDEAKMTSVVGVPDELFDVNSTSEWNSGDRPTVISSASLLPVWQPWYGTPVGTFPVTMATTTSGFQLPISEQWHGRTATSACSDNTNTTYRPTLDAVLDLSAHEQQLPPRYPDVSSYASESKVLGPRDLNLYGNYGNTMSVPSDRVWSPYWQSIGRHKSRALGHLSIPTPSVAVCHQISALPALVDNESLLSPMEFHQPQFQQPPNAFFGSEESFPIWWQQQQKINGMGAFPFPQQCGSLFLEDCYSNSTPTPRQFLGNTLQKVTPNFNNVQMTDNSYLGFFHPRQLTPFPRNLRPVNLESPATLCLTSGSMGAAIGGSRVESQKRSVSSLRDINDAVQQALENWTVRNVNRSPYPTVEERRQLAEVTGMTTHEITRWFKNYRSRLRRKEFKERIGRLTN